MNRKTLIALLGAIVVALTGSGAALAAGSGPSVSVQIKSTTKTLLAPTMVHGETGWITKGGTPKGKCPGASAAGALDAATHGRWTGKYYSSVGGVFVSSILGVKPTGQNGYWAVYVNGKASSKGVCGVSLRAGQKLLFKLIK
jgi:FlaG/FlaF family flagellin (archaellin)